MCGICGLIDWRGQGVDESLVLKMRDVMITRGPDDAGIHLENGVGLAHRRLSIIDLSPAGHQPMSNEDGSIWITFNGEIYNFQDLRPQLVAAGHQFRSHSDTEVLIHGYEQWGLDGLVKRISGMFAFGIWDRPGKKLHLVRDRLGKKPLFYRYSGGRLWFSSDIKSIWLVSPDSLQLNPQALDDYLYQYFVSQKNTIFQGVDKLQPGHLATFEATGKTVRRYWAPDYGQKSIKSNDELIEAINGSFSQAVQRRMISDVPLGAFLSGGVDSSCVCAAMAKLGSQKPRTFSVGINNVPQYDERKYSRMVAEHIGSQHQELVVEADMVSHLSDLVWQYGEPFGDSSMVPCYLIAQAARKYVTVVLTGDGGDEAFAGYDWYLSANRGQKLSWLPGILRNYILPAAAKLATAIAPSSMLSRRIELHSGHLRQDRLALAARFIWYNGLRRQLYSGSWQKGLGDYSAYEAMSELVNSLTGPTHLDRCLEFAMLHLLPGDFLAKVDVATMAHSLEARCPFLDVDLLQLAMSIDSQQLIFGGQPKALLKKYAEQLMPREAIYRPKWGFGVPVGEWYRGKMQGMVKSLLLSKTFADRGYFNPRMVEKTVQQHLSGKANHTDRIWTLLIFEIWNRLFVDRTLKPGDPVI